jgi:hypothetical protein
MAGSDLKTYRDATCFSPYSVCKIFKVIRSAQIGKGSRTDGRRSFFQSPHLGDFTHHFIARQMSPGAGFRPLSTFEMESLYLFEFVPAKAKLCRSQLVKIP